MLRCATRLCRLSLAIAFLSLLGCGDEGNGTITRGQARPAFLRMKGASSSTDSHAVSARVALVPEGRGSSTIEIDLQESQIVKAHLVHSERYALEVVSVMAKSSTDGAKLVPGERFIAHPATIQLADQGFGLEDPLEISLSPRPGPCTLQIELEPYGDSSSRVRVELAEDGRYTTVSDLEINGREGRLSGLWPGSYRVTLLEAGAGSANFRILEGGFGYGRIRTTVSVADEGVTRTVLRPPQAGLVRVVIDRRGLPESLPAGFLSFHRRFERYWGPVPHAPAVTDERDVAESGRRELHLTYGNVPTGTYRLLLRRTGFAVQVQQIEVVPGGETMCRFGDYKPGATVTVQWPGKIPSTDDYGDATPFGLNRIDYDTAQDVGLGVIRENSRSLVLRGLRPGRYIAVVWAIGLARIVQVTAPTTEVVLQPPTSFIEGGSRQIHVTVHGKSAPLNRLMVGLVPAGTALDAGEWFRFRSLGRSATFVSVPRGEYELVVFDGAFGVRYGFASSPLRRVVRVEEEDVTVRFDV